MTDRPISPALVEAGARAIAANETVPPIPDRYDNVKSWTIGEPDERQHPETRAACVRDIERWERLATAVLEAILPMVREECAKIADEHLGPDSYAAAAIRSNPTASVAQLDRARDS